MIHTTARLSYSRTSVRQYELREISQRLGVGEIKQDWLLKGLPHGHDWGNEEYYHFRDVKINETEEGTQPRIGQQ
jgi:hypothetical protein